MCVVLGGVLDNVGSGRLGHFLCFFLVGLPRFSDFAFRVPYINIVLPIWAGVYGANFPEREHR